MPRLESRKRPRYLEMKLRAAATGSLPRPVARNPRSSISEAGVPKRFQLTRASRADARFRWAGVGSSFPTGPSMSGRPSCDGRMLASPNAGAGAKAAIPTTAASNTATHVLGPIGGSVSKGAPLGVKREAPGAQAPWHFLYFLPEPHQHGSLRPILSRSDFTTVAGFSLDAPLPPDPAPAAPAGTGAVAPGITPGAGEPPLAIAAWEASSIAEGCSGPPPAYVSSSGPLGSGSKSAGSMFTSTWKMTRANSSQMEFMSSRNMVKPSFL